MLLIRCPYCEEERPELEFRNAGEAHIARSANIAGESDDDFEKFFFIRSNPKGIIYERWRHMHGCARFFNAVRDTVTDKFVMTYKAGEPKPSSCPRTAGEGLPNERRVPHLRAPVASSQAKTARFSFDGQSYTGIEGDTLASALLANGVHLVGRSFKYHRPRGFLSAGAEEPNALVQIERDEARKTPNVRATVQELYDGLAAQLAEPLAVARLRRRRGQRHCLADVFGRLLLQDLHVAEGGLEEPLRAQDPRSRRPWRFSGQARSRPLFLALRALRRAGAGRRCGRHRGGTGGGRNRRARHPRRRAGRIRRQPAFRDAARRSTARTVLPGRRRRSPG